MIETINERIARCRKLANLTQTEAAEKMGMKCSTYSQMERKGSISTDRLLVLADIFNVNPDILLYGMEINKINTESTIVNGYINPNNSPVLNQEANTFSSSFSSTPFIASHKEENIIKILRNLPKDMKEEVIDYINEKYKQSKQK